ncbi:protein L-Myc-1b [Latimeria chalumnae]|uniref:MYCL proto-onco, bHLH transcription factor n=1 Tax=Latimeria chalumnae TaxID=7897 RepID=H3B173_LATCH|nr:PREDICTED: protein L-Myc [Latimeria chalumnae]|eukprot:XP_005993959.1 PREDICTED: protein L-Myc [Latimeria chalumnae]
MEYDTSQHYFYDDDNEEDFYRSIAPSEDIWKKFELVPTPPASPAWITGDKNFYPSSGDKLEWVSEFLGADEEQFKINPGEIWGNLSSIIIHDCMWSGFSPSERLEKVMTERLSTGAPLRANNAHKPSFALDFGLNTNSIECVDPTAVFPHPLHENKISTSSGSESQSDPEEEEIDVVTVDKRQSLNVRKPVTITVRADPHDPCMKRFHISIHQQQHNYAAPSPDICLEEAPLPKQEPVCLPETQVLQSGPQAQTPNCSASPPNSDTEDLAKRKNHNFLERKRRNDLRSRFLALRDQVPELTDNSKTPKVVILSKATEYLRILTANEKRMTLEKKQLKIRQQHLLKRVAQLQGR